MVETIKNHIGYEVDEEKMDQLAEFMKFENYQRTSSLNKREENKMWTGKGQFIRKGIVGDWRNHFNTETAENWNNWVQKEFKKMGFEDEQLLKRIKCDF